MNTKSKNSGSNVNANSNARKWRVVASLFVFIALAGTAAFASTYTAFGKSLYEGSVDLLAVFNPLNETAARQVADPARGAPGSNLEITRQGSTETVLPDGRVLITGGRTTAGQVLSTIEIYDPSTRTSAVVGSLSVGRAGHSATLLADGRLFVAGGNDGAGRTW